MSPKRGFTLLEVLVVLVIMALATAATSLVFSGALRQNRLRASASLVLEADLLARQKSRVENVVVTSSSENGIQYLIVRTEGNGFLRRFELPRLVQLSARDSKDNPLTEITFAPNEGSVDYFVTLSEKHQRLVISIAGATGHAREE